MGTPKNGGTAAPEALNELNGFFTHVCKSCIDHKNGKALCALAKPIVAGIIEHDDREYEDPTAKFCKEIDVATDTNPVFCTADAKECPNGKYVSRDPKNNCEFKPCEE